MPIAHHPLTTLTELLHTNGWDVQLVGTHPVPHHTSQGVAYVVPATPLPTYGGLR